MAAAIANLRLQLPEGVESKMPEDHIAGYLKHCEDLAKEIASQKICHLSSSLGGLIDVVRMGESHPHMDQMMTLAVTMIASIERVDFRSRTAPEIYEDLTS